MLIKTKQMQVLFDWTSFDTNATWHWVILVDTYVSHPDLDVSVLSMRKSHMNSDLTIRTAITSSRIRYVSDLRPHIKVDQIRIEKIGFHVIQIPCGLCGSHCHEKSTNLGHFCLLCEHSVEICLEFSMHC